MAKKVGSVYAEIRADIKKLQQDFDKAHNVTIQSSKKIQATLDKGINFNKASDSLARFQKLMAVGFAGVGIQRIASSFLDTAASFETMRVKLEALEGSRGTRLFEALNKMALELPVSTEKVVQAFVTMQAMGLEPTRKQMLILSDVAAVLGDDVLGRVVLQLGQMSAKGKISAQDLNVMAEAGINVRKILAETFGKTVEELQASGIEISKVTDAIFEGMNKKFGGSSEKMMNTWRGVTELMKSNWIEIERTIADAGVFQFLKDEVKGVSDGLKTWLEVNRETIKQDLPGYVDKVRAAVAAVKGQFDALWKIITYDPAIIEYGLLGLLIGGKKGAILAGGVAHLINIPGMLVEASILAKEGYVNVSDIVAADYKELEKIIEKAKKLKASGPPEPLALLPAHGTTLAPAHGEFKRTGDELSDTADGWRKRWQDEWNVWGFKIDSKFFIKPKTEEEIEKELAKIKVAAKKALEEHKAMIEAYAETAQTQFPSVSYDVETQRVKSYQDSMKTMQKSHEDFEKNNQELWKNGVTYGQETLDEWVKLTERTADAMQENFSNLFFDAMTGKLKTLEDYAKAVFDSIARMASDMAAQQLTQGLFGKDMQGGGWLSTLFNSIGGSGSTGMGTNTTFSSGTSMGGYMAMVKHGGGSFASGGATRAIPASYFATAPRLHQGLAADEYAAVLQKGEQVIPKGKGKAQPIVHMHFYSQSGKYDRESISQAQSGLYASLSRANRRNS